MQFVLPHAPTPVHFVKGERLRFCFLICVIGVYSSFANEFASLASIRSLKIGFMRKKTISKKALFLCGQKSRDGLRPWAIFMRRENKGAGCKESLQTSWQAKNAYNVIQQDHAGYSNTTAKCYFSLRRIAWREAILMLQRSGALSSEIKSDRMNQCWSLVHRKRY